MQRRELVLHGAITDMLVLEESLGRALREQVEDFDGNNADTAHHLRYVATFVNAHIERLSDLKARNDTLSNRVGNVVRRAGTLVAGLGNSAVEFVRNESMPTQLQKNYSAASMAYAGYRMLFTTASALRDGETCRMAAEFLSDYSRITMLLQDLLPDAVVTQLEADGLQLEEPVTRSRNANRVEAIPVHVG